MEWLTVVVTLIVLFTILLICRELSCWYFKINERVEIMHDIRELLTQEKENE